MNTIQLHEYEYNTNPCFTALPVCEDYETRKGLRWELKQEGGEQEDELASLFIILLIIVLGFFLVKGYS
jgi:hypothetical protein